MLYLKNIQPYTEVGFHAKDQLAGFFKLTAIRPDGRRRPLTDWIPNLITNAGLDNFGFGGSTASDAEGWIGTCSIGTGNSAPAYTNTSLDTQLSRVGHTSRNAGVAPPGTDPFYRYQRTTYTFPVGTATGIIAELGVGPNTARGGLLSTRALPVDQVGDPTTVPVLADEQLEVVYEIRTYITDVTVQNSQITIDATLFDTKRLPALIGSNINPWFNYGAGVVSIGCYKDPPVNIGADEFDEPNDIMETPNSTRQTYSSGLFYRDSICLISRSEAEYGAYGITGMLLNGYLSQWQMSFTQNGDPSKGIIHTNLDDLYVTTRHSWVRYEP